VTWLTKGDDRLNEFGITLTTVHLMSTVTAQLVARTVRRNVSIEWTVTEILQSEIIARLKSALGRGQGNHGTGLSWLAIRLSRASSGWHGSASTAGNTNRATHAVSGMRH
jgi:hypothetical protein